SGELGRRALRNIVRQVANAVLRRGLMTRFRLAVALTVAGAFGLIAIIVPRTSDDPAPRVHYPLADTLPWLTLETPDGRSAGLHERLGGKPALIYIVNVAECASCSNLEEEFRILNREFPRIRPLVVGSGSKSDVFRPYLQQMHVLESALIDE